jgi:hypothetical protein
MMRRQSEPESEESEEQHHRLVELLQPKLLKFENRGFSDCGCRRDKKDKSGKGVVAAVEASVVAVAGATSALQ